MLNLKIPLVKKMKAHLKSKNFSWDPNSKFKEIYFDKPIGYIFQKKTGTTLVLNSKKNFFPNKDIFAIIKTELKGKYLVGYFSEFNIKNSKEAMMQYSISFPVNLKSQKQKITLVLF